MMTEEEEGGCLFGGVGGGGGVWVCWSSATMLQNDQTFRNQPNKENDFHSIFLEHNHIEK